MSSRPKKRLTSNAMEIFEDIYRNDPEMLKMVDEEYANCDIAQRIYDLRAAAGLTQRQLAKRVGTTASVICRLEDADYEGHSLSMLRRVAAALDHEVTIQVKPIKRGKARARRPSATAASSQHE